MSTAASEVNSSRMGPSVRVPTRILDKGLLSTTDHAHDCYVYQQFSSTLQSYMINYVLSVSSYQSVYVKG